MRVALLALLLTGCLSTNPEQWTHAPDELTHARRAIYECQADAREVSARATAFGGVVVPIVGLFHMRQVFRDCMASRGFHPPE